MLYWIFYMYATTFATSSIFYLLMEYTPLGSLMKLLLSCVVSAENLPKPEDPNASGVTLGKAYELCTKRRTSAGWFTTSDVMYRYGLVQLGFVWTLLTNPVSFPIYCAKYNLIWHGPIVGTVLTLMYPITPVAMILYQIKESI